MKISGNTVLITGGGTGIGLALAEEFVNAGNTVIICGRRHDKLVEAKKKLPSIHIKACDLSNPIERDEFYKWMISNFKDLNILVNNAGIQRIVNFKKGVVELRNGEDETVINLVAPIELSAYFVPFFNDREEAAIINITSGLAFAPLALFPIYCATKAALHSFSVSLRHQLKNTQIKVFEIIPPTTDTELDKGMRAKRGAEKGISAAEVAKEAIKAIRENKYEVAIGQAKDLSEKIRTDSEPIFERMNGRIEF